MALSAGARRVSGSSPLARGTPGADELITPLNGLIPARAGNTAVMKAWAVTWRAHPRSRGEHSGHESVGCHLEGSSPLARGTRELVHDQKVQAGLIPARAGNTGNHRG